MVPENNGVPHGDAADIRKSMADKRRELSGERLETGVSDLVLVPVY